MSTKYYLHFHGTKADGSTESGCAVEGGTMKECRDNAKRMRKTPEDYTDTDGKPWKSFESVYVTDERGQTVKEL